MSCVICICPGRPVDSILMENNNFNLIKLNYEYGDINGLPVCQRHIVAPYIELDASCAYNAAQHGAGVNANSHRHTFVAF